MSGLNATWSQGICVGTSEEKLHDKEWAAVNPINGHLYVTWTQFDQYLSTQPNHFSNILFSSSTDGGQHWSAPKRINETPGNCLDDDDTVEGATPAVGPDGEIYVSWAGPLGIVFDKSTDEGNTWLENDIIVSDNPGGWLFPDVPGIHRCGGQPVIACDRSNGSYRGTIYINWSDERNGTHDQDIWVSKSTDKGMSWSKSVRVNDDPPGKQQCFSWMAVDQMTGILYIIFYDRRHYNNNHYNRIVIHQPILKFIMRRIMIHGV